MKFYNIKIDTSGGGYVIKVKKHWWSRWKPLAFTFTGSQAIILANNIIQFDNAKINQE